jgi:hypothetical protein
MLMSYEERRQMILETLAPRPGEEADSRAIAVRALWSWKQIALHLTPLIGEAGFHSLYARTIRLAISDFGGLTLSAQSESFDTLFQKLGQDLELLAPVEAVRASNILLATFTELLSTLIGESLTSRILRSAWADESGGANAQEVKK